VGEWVQMDETSFHRCYCYDYDDDADDGDGDSDEQNELLIEEL